MTTGTHNINVLQYTVQLCGFKILRDVNFPLDKLGDSTEIVVTGPASYTKLYFRYIFNCDCSILFL